MQTYKELIDSQFPDCNIVSVYLQFYKLPEMPEQQGPLLTVAPLGETL